MPRGNIDNLIKNSDLTPEERQEKAQKAGKKSGEVRAQRKKLKDEFLALLEVKMTDPNDNNKKVTTRNRIAARMIEECLNGNVKAAVFVRDTIGEKPKETVNFESDSLTGIKISFVDKSNRNTKKEKDPKIVGEYTPPSNAEEGK